MNDAIELPGRRRGEPATDLGDAVARSSPGWGHRLVAPAGRRLADDPGIAHAGVLLGPGPGQTPGWDFFISYTSQDRAWAEWIAWQLDQAGYSVVIRAWNVVPGSNYHAMIDEAIERSRHTVAVLSSTSVKSVCGNLEWQAAQRRDPRGFARRLVPIRVGDCAPPGLLGSVVSFDLFDAGSEIAARRRLLRGIEAAVNGHDRPAAAPSFPAGQENRAMSAGGGYAGRREPGVR